MELNVPISYPSPINDSFGASENTEDKNTATNRTPPDKSTILLGNTNLPSFNLAINHKKNDIVTNVDNKTPLLTSTEILKNGMKNIGIRKPSASIKK